MKRKVARLAVRLAVSLALLGAIAWAVDASGLLRRVAQADFSWFLLAVLLGILANVVSAWRWLLIARQLGLSATARHLLPAYGRNVTLNTILPGATVGGDAYRALALQKLGNPILPAAASVALDRLSGLWALFVISWLAWLALALADTTALLRAGLSLHLTGLALAVAAPFVARALARRLPVGASGLPARGLRLLAETARLALLTFPSSALVQLATIAALWAAMRAITTDIPIVYLAASAAPVFLAAALPVSIGGYGTREAALAAYWLMAGLPAEIAVAGGLLHGLAVTLQGALWAPLFLLEHHGTARR